MKRLLCTMLVMLLLVALAGCEDFTISIDFAGDDPTAVSGESTVPEERTVPSLPGETVEATAPTEVTPGIVSTEPPVKDNDPRPSTPNHTPTPLEALWDKLSGCWVGDEERFVYFTYNDDGPAFLSGFWENPVPYNREPASVTSVTDLGGGRYVLNMTYPPNEENAADSQDLRPLDYTIGVEIQELHKGVIHVEAPEDGWRYYSFGGYSYDDAYDGNHDVQYATFAEMQQFWQWLGGYWNSDDGRFICFDQADSNSLVFMEGIWNSGSRGWGEFEKAMSGYMDLPMKFVIYYPPVENELDGELPSAYLMVYLDFTEMETNGSISVKLDENGVWRKYHYAGASYEEAYPYD